jgi:IclR family transcriptional regulator, acetate operon repressor
MRKIELHKKPPYPLASVDNALHLLQLLRDTGSLRLKDAAEELSVAPSTAHRLLAMLIYRGFAIQDENRRYLPGPAMGEGPAGMRSTRHLKELAQPHLELLASRVGETVNLMIRVGTKVRFLTSVEGSGILRVGDRQGAVLPAHRTSGGKAMLAELDASTLDKLFRSELNMADDRIPDSRYPAFLNELDLIRANGFAANYEGTEQGVSAIGVAVHDPLGLAIAALSVSTPTTRFASLVSSGLARAALQTAHELELDIAAHPFEPS